ncbi:Uncharacterised protein [Vibrio cholerae]|nr:Uncharacterised protein [Vibrio cholerae]
MTGFQFRLSRHITRWWVVNRTGERYRNRQYTRAQNHKAGLNA